MSAREPKRSASRRLTKPHIAVRPTIRLAGVLIGAAVLLVFAGNMQSIALAAGAGTLIAAATCSLVSVLLAYRRVQHGGMERWTGDATGRKRGTDRGHTAERAGQLAARFVAAALPAPQTADATWERLDQRDELVETFSSAEVPSTRGLYRRCRATVELHDCLGLWHAHLDQQISQEHCVPPRVGAASGAGVSQTLPAGQPPFLETQLDTALVRPYERGDSLRAISWRQTAHHGQLMSFETAPAGTERTVILVDTTTPGHDDKLAAEAATCFAALRARGARPFLTDGVVTAETDRDAQRFTAGLRSVEPNDAQAITHLAAGAWSLATAGGKGLSQVIVVTAETNGTFEQVVRAAFRDCPVHAITIPDDEAARLAPDERHPSTPSIPPADTDARPLLAALIATVCCIASFAATLAVLTTLIAPANWTTFAAGTLALVTLDAVALGQLPVLRRHRIVRLLITVFLLLGVLCTGAVQAMETLGFTSSDLVSSVLTMPRDAAAGESIVGPLPALAGILVGGIMQLIIDQWVPVEVTPVSDAALILAVALAAVPLRILLASRHLRPVIAILPLAVLAVRLVFMGTPDGAPWIPAILTCMPVLIALIRPQRRWAAQVAPLTAISVALACAIAPQTLSLAQRIPLDLHISSDAFLERDVSSLIDLCDGLQRGRPTTALTYATDAERPLYLRLSTLDSFDGTTWSTAHETTGGLFSGLFGGSSGASLADGSPELTPAMLAGRVTQRSVGALAIISADVTIQHLSAGNLPVPSGTFALTGDAAERTDAGWHWTADGALSGPAATEQGLRYHAQSAYLDPVTSPAQLSELTALPNALERMLEETQADDSTSAQLPARSAWLDGVANQPDRRYRELPADLPAAVTAVVAQAREQGVGAESSTDALIALDDQLAAMNYLLEYFTDGSFSYTLDTPDGDEPDNLAALGAFLERKSGWCAHYATALAVLGRNMGLSTRVALGYRARGAAATDGLYRASNRDLHTWTEVFLTGIGWVPFDVTPDTGTDNAGETGSADDTTTGSENMPDTNTPADDSPGEAAPDETPEQPTDNKQAETPTFNTATSPLDAFLAHASSALAAARRWLQTVAPYLLGGAIVAAILIAPRAIRTHRTKRRLEAIRTGTPHAAQAAWDEVTDTARDTGATWPASATEEDIAQVLITHMGATPDSRAARDIKHLARAACHARYAPASAPAPEPAPDLTMVQRLLTSLDRTASARHIVPPSLIKFGPGSNLIS